MTITNPLVSVIIPFYNEQDFLEESILSVLNQEYKNWELLLIDDGSTNKSTEIAKKFAHKNPEKIRYLEHLNHRNKGSSASRNKGIECARGTLIAFLDADDIFEPNYLFNQVHLFTETNASMICEATLYWYSWTNKNQKDKIIEVGAPQDRLYRPQELNRLLYPLKMGAAAPCMCGIIILKDILVQHGGFDESFTGMYDDQVFLSKIYYHEPVFISSSCNNRYRQRSGSLMSTTQESKDYLKIRTKFFLWFKTYLDNCETVNKKIYSEVKRTLLSLKYPRYNAIIYRYPARIINNVKRIFNF